jgi:hypothetical protein
MHLTEHRNYFNISFFGHYIHRSIIYTLKAPSMAPTNVTVVGMAIIFNLCNGYTNGLKASQTPSEYLSSPRFWIGLVIFYIGLYINVKSDRILFALRQKKKQGKADVDPDADPIKGRYYIPRGFMYNYVSAANYLGEIVEWVG